MKPGPKTYEWPIYFNRKCISHIGEEIWEILLDSKHPRVLEMQKLISELRIQNPNLSIEDITAIMERNNTHPELIRLVIWKKGSETNEDDNTDRLIDDNLIRRNPNLTREDIKKRMDEVELSYKWKNRRLF